MSPGFVPIRRRCKVAAVSAPGFDPGAGAAVPRPSGSIRAPSASGLAASRRPALGVEHLRPGPGRGRDAQAIGRVVQLVDAPDRHVLQRPLGEYQVDRLRGLRGVHPEGPTGLALGERVALEDQRRLAELLHVHRLAVDFHALVDPGAGELRDVGPGRVIDRIGQAGRHQGDYDRRGLDHLRLLSGEGRWGMGRTRGAPPGDSGETPPGFPHRRRDRGSGELHHLDLADLDLAARVVLLEGEEALGVGVLRVLEVDDLLAVDPDDDVVAHGLDLLGEPGVGRDEHLLHGDEVVERAGPLGVAVGAVDLGLVALGEAGALGGAEVHARVGLVGDLDLGAVLEVLVVAPWG